MSTWVSGSKGVFVAAAGLSVFGLAASQAHGQARSIKVTQNSATETLQLAEVLAFQSGSGTNVASQANGGVASATSEAFGTVAGDANDGVTDGAFGNGSVWHSAGASGEMLTVTFSADTNISSIQLFGRTDCCQPRDDNITVQLLNAAGTPIFTTQTGIPDNDQEITIQVPEPIGIGIVGLGALGLLARRPRPRR